MNASSPVPRATIASPPPVEARSPSRSTDLGGLALAMAGAICFSTKTVVAKLLYAQGLDAVSLIALRMLLAAPVFVGVAIWTWRATPRLSLADHARIAGLGLIGYYGSSMLDFLGLEHISAGLGRLILFMAPTFVLLISLLVFRRRASARQWLSMAVAYAGIVLVFWHDARLGGADVVRGSMLVLAAALTYAIYLLLSGELLKRIGTLRLVALAMSSSSLACIAQYAALRGLPSLFHQSAAIWGLSLVNAGLCTVLPVFLTMIAVARLGAGTASQAGMIGPVSTLFLGAWLLGEPITLLQLAGTALVLAGIFLLSYRRAPAS